MAEATKRRMVGEMVNSELERIWVEMVATKSRHLYHVSNNWFTNINVGTNHVKATINVQY